LNAVEIEDAISQLAEQEFDAEAFPFAFLDAFYREYPHPDFVPQAVAQADESPNKAAPGFVSAHLHLLLNLLLHNVPYMIQFRAWVKK